MRPVQLSVVVRFYPRPFICYRSVFVHRMMPAQILIPARVIPVRIQRGSCTGTKFSFSVSCKRGITARFILH